MTPFILYRYIGRSFLINMLIAYGVIVCIAGLIDMIETFRRTSVNPNIGYEITLQMAGLRIVHLAEKLLPYSIMIAAMMTLMRLMRTSELVVVRASGVSVWRFLAPILMISFALGLISIALLNPLSAATIARYERMEAKYLQNNEHLFSVSTSGLWLKHNEKKAINLAGLRVQNYIMQAKYISQSDMSLRRVVVFLQDENDNFVGRIDANGARLYNKYWRMNHAVLSTPGKAPERQVRFILPTELNIRQLQNSFAEPSTLSFWELGEFIETLQKAGFSAIRHKLYWYSILITPLIYASMVLVAAIFSLRLPRKGKMVLMVSGAVITGFVLHFMGGLFHAFGYSGSLSIEVSVIAPYLVALLLSTIILLHMEDG
jgi:lipopolysaccharide export system permease protein